MIAGRHLVLALTLACLHQPATRGDTDGDPHTNLVDGELNATVVRGAWPVPPPNADPPPPPATTASSAMLGYIFDAHVSSNRHQHHTHGDARWGPHFEGGDVESAADVVVQAGETATLHCLISMLQDKTVSWVRRNAGPTASSPGAANSSVPGGGGLQLLTVGRDAYAGDPRFQIHFQYPNDWRLRIANARAQDQGVYECQISTHPPKVIRVNLRVNAPEVVIVDEHGRPLLDKYYEVASTIQLTCLVRHVAMTTAGQVVLWTHGALALNYDVTRGGISVRTDMTEEGAVSILSVARINQTDSGNYTCSINASQNATVNVHVLNESIAELHDGGGNGFRVSLQMALLCLLAALMSS